ncbi:diguanylate cyclase (GGDEF) domain-containing protein [Halolactibacillus halophilus]|uniref:Diguanylate cyclase (GGDEF) domain-containing protein n=1 Tax=Halolactibacillus halophilus TaxID=306540 RepID=A0A1I5N0G3_9BACI|nr:GGDEF domain-containing protein [Halolactibacillus halophilus]GEM01104.1 hypothetical protein HHA03_06360 [Halolactibacillus halophilus]SFP15284.1 diguanylate cyclase (GGDEF) domain-containing protein [Halolactibacillus halophilus]
MEYFVQFQLNVFALLIVVILYAMIKLKLKVKSYGKFLLRIIMLVSAVAIIVEPLTWIFDGKVFPFSYVLEYGTNILLFLVGPVLGGLLMSYVDYHTFHDPKRLGKRLFYQQWSVVTVIILIVNLFNPIYFEVDPVTNIYSSGDFKDFHYVVLASIYIYMIVSLYRHRRLVTKHAQHIFTWFFMLPILGMIVQLFNSRLYFSWTSVVLGILVAYIFLESQATEEDHLTKLYNRQSYEMYVEHLIEGNQPFSFNLFDLNHFKMINDTYGHLAGDQTLIAFGQVLKRVFDKNALVSRLGGDEFVVVIEGEYVNETYHEQINSLLQQYEENYIKQVSFSSGLSVKNGFETTEQIYQHADHKLYKEKRTYHQSLVD